MPELGWHPFFEAQLNGDEAGTPGRVCEELRGAYRVLTEAGELLCTLPGRLLHQAAERPDFPAVGDWVIARAGPAGRGVIVRLLQRRSRLSRQMAGERTGEQILAANVDVVFVVASLNQELNLRRLERYLTMAWDSGARPVIVLNKADLSDAPFRFLRPVEDIAPRVPVHLTSAVEASGLEALRLEGGETAVFVGSSGVGKSSLINRLLGEEVQEVRVIREDDARGRHTTTSRQLLRLPGGGVVIDTPGLRELQLWDAQAEGVGRAFADIEALVARCAFSDCRHEAEPGCAVVAAIGAGTLDEERYRSYQKLERELEYAAHRQDRAYHLEQKRRWKRIHKENRRRLKAEGR